MEFLVSYYKTPDIHINLEYFGITRGEVVLETALICKLLLHTNTALVTVASLLDALKYNSEELLSHKATFNSKINNISPFIIINLEENKVNFNFKHALYRTCNVPYSLTDFILLERSKEGSIHDIEGFVNIAEQMSQYNLEETYFAIPKQNKSTSIYYFGDSMVEFRHYYNN